MSTEPEMDIENHTVGIEELIVRPGTYFNPQTEVLVVVDDSASIDQTIFNMEAYEGAEWVHVSDEVPVDEEQRDAILLDFQSSARSTAGVPEDALEVGDDEDLSDLDEEEELEPDEEPGAEQAAAAADDDEEEA